MTPQHIQTLLSEDMTDVLEFCETVSLSGSSEDPTQSTSTSVIHREIAMLSPTSCREILDVHGPQVEASSTLFVFEFSEEFQHDDEVSEILETNRYHYSFGEIHDDAMSDISESLSDDGTFSFVDEENFPLNPNNVVSKNRDAMLQDDMRRTSTLTWTSRYSMLEDPSVVQGANTIINLAR